jgi:hypothetical protein
MAGSGESNSSIFFTTGIPTPAVLQLPFIGLLEQHCSDQPNDRGFIGENAHYVGATLDFFVEPLEWIGAVQLASVLLREVELG